MTLRGIYQQDGVVYTCIYTMHTCISSSYRYRYTRAHTQLYRLLNEYKKIVAGGGLALWAGGSAGEDAMTIKPAINQNGLAIWRHCAGPRLRATAYIPSWPNGDLFFFFFIHETKIYNNNNNIPAAAVLLYGERAPVVAMVRRRFSDVRVALILFCRNILVQVSLTLSISCKSSGVNDFRLVNLAKNARFRGIFPVRTLYDGKSYRRAAAIFTQRNVYIIILCIIDILDIYE